MSRVAITYDIIKKGHSSVDGWNEDQAEALGFSWPLPSNWINAAVDKQYTKSQIFQFLALKTPEPPKPFIITPVPTREEQQQKLQRKREKNRRKKLRRQLRRSKSGKDGGDNLLPDDVPSFSYADRNEFLRTIGFESYQAYQQSGIWKSVRIRVYQRFGKRCVFCKSRKATAIHHSCYTEANLQGSSIAGLHPICTPCHEAIEYTKSGYKLTAEEARKKSRSLFYQALDSAPKKKKRKKRKSK